MLTDEDKQTIRNIVQSRDRTYIYILLALILLNSCSIEDKVTKLKGAVEDVKTSIQDMRRQPESAAAAKSP